MTNYTLRSATETVTFQPQQPKGITDPELAMVWIHKCPKGADAGSYMARKYMVQTARVIYRELVSKGYAKGLGA